MEPEVPAATSTMDEPTEPEVEHRLPLEMLVDLDASPEASAPPALAQGTVVESAPLAVLVGGRTRAARRAKSCLVAAERGDSVLCSISGETVHVLAVLDGAPDTRIVTDGALSVQASGELSLAGQHLRLSAKSALAAIEELRVVGKTVEAHVGAKATLVAERVETHASRFLLRAKQAFRFVQELEQVRAGNLDMRAESLASLRGENTIVAARVLTKIDGEQVKIG